MGSFCNVSINALQKSLSKQFLFLSTVMEFQAQHLTGSRCSAVCIQMIFDAVKEVVSSGAQMKEADLRS